ncbi:apoptosis regulator Bcl-2-like [Limulus polyphemus]|uniref:Apoptosis regulator Bcl-2-like n=1 Tax=Limulus polyphemus TaxID=6850 RepID=A0ABM1BGQ5_LIMPO|nr:apoptosis regulator Bcl-2-like [Limulus polyphemus]
MANCNGYRSTSNSESENDVYYLAADYLKFHLSRKGLECSLCPDSDRLTMRIGEKVRMKIRSLGEDMDKQFCEQFAEIRSKLDITQSSLQTAFFGVINELFSEGIKWSNIITLFVFSGEMAVNCIEKGWHHHVNNIAWWLTTYICDNLLGWVDDHGGWDGLVEYAENREEQKSDSSWPVFKKICGVAAGIGALTLGAILASKS